MKVKIEVEVDKRVYGDLIETALTDPAIRAWVVFAGLVVQNPHEQRIDYLQGVSDERICPDCLNSNEGHGRKRRKRHVEGETDLPT